MIRKYKFGKSQSQSRILYILLIVASLFIVSNCGDGEEAEEVASTNVVSTNTPCSTNISRTRYPSEYSPIFIHVLIEGTQSYKDLILPSFEMLSEVLKVKVDPNDKVMISFMEYTNTDLSRFFNMDVANVPIPQYSYTPLIIPTFPTVEPLPTTESTFGRFVQTTAVQITETAYSSLLTEVANSHNCIQVVEEGQNAILFEDWNQKRQQSIDRFLGDYQKAIGELKLAGLPEITNPVSALSQASEIFELFRASDTFGKNYLIVFSNLGSVIANPPAADGVNLRGVDVLITLQECTFLSDCSATVSRWEKYFKEAGASTVTFIQKGEEKSVLLQKIVR